MTGAGCGGDDVAYLREAAAQVAAGGDARAVTAHLPALLWQQNTQLACALVMQFGHIEAIRAEAMALLDMSGISAAQKREMLIAISPLFSNMASPAAAALAAVAARAARYGFCFPRWRFLTQRAGNMPALMESYGFERLERATDVRAPDLPRSNPARDLFGIGFVREVDGWVIEYRRAYLLCARRGDTGAAVVIRNSSYFFGRDRMPQPLYAAWGDVLPQELHALDERSFEQGGLFAPWPEALTQRPDIPAADKIRRLQALIDRLDAEEKALSGWICHDGAAAVKGFIAAAGGVYIALADAASPPWFPAAAAPAGAAHFDALRSELAAADGKEARVIAFLSGPAGDFPTPPVGLAGWKGLI